LSGQRATSSPDQKQEKEMKLRMTLIIAIFCAAAPAWSQTQPGTAAAPPQHIPGQPATKTAGAAATDKPAEKLDPAKEAAIRHLMDITETSKMGDGLHSAITAKVRDAMSRALPPEQLPKFMDTFSQKFAANAPSNAVTDAMIPIYAKNFTMEDVQGLTKFYESALGQRVVKVLPEIVQQSQAAGVQIEQPIAISTLRSMETEYPQLQQMLPPDPSAPAPSPTPAVTPGPAPRLTPSTPGTTTPPAPATPPQQ
jgi:uncharacterized protein